MDGVILIDDASRDNTAAVARRRASSRSGTITTAATAATRRPATPQRLARGADIVVMLHPDYQYTPAWSRRWPRWSRPSIRRRAGLAHPRRGRSGGRHALLQISSQPRADPRCKTSVGQKLSEYHTGYRAWSRTILQRLPLMECSDDFVFDNQMLAQAIHFGFRIGEISCPTKYFPEASSINFSQRDLWPGGAGHGAGFTLEAMGLAKPHS